MAGGRAAQGGQRSLAAAPVCPSTARLLPLLLLPALCCLPSRTNRSLIPAAGCDPAHVPLRSSPLRSPAAQVEAILQKPESIKLLVEVLDTRTPATFENLLDSLKKILHASARVNQALGDSRFVPKLVERLSHPTPVIRVNLLRMLTSIYEHNRNPKKMVMEHNLMRVVERMAQNDKAVLVKEIAGQLQKAFKANDFL